MDSQTAAAAAVWHMPVAVCAVLSSWWWTERPSETCRAFYKSKWFEKQVHLVGCTITMIFYVWFGLVLSIWYEGEKPVEDCGR